MNAPIRLTLLLLLLLIVPLRAEDAASLFHRATTAHAHAQYAEAIALYERIAASGQVSPELYANLGAACYKRGMLGRSILAYERALRLSPADPDILHDLNVLRARTRDRVDPVPLLFLARWWRDAKLARTPAALFGWSVVAAWLLAFCVFLFFVTRGVWARRGAFAGGLLFATLFLIAIALWLGREQDLQRRADAVVIPATVPVMSAPDRTGVESFQIHEGLKVRILAERDGALRIRLEDGKTGWVAPSSVERI